MKKYAKKLAAGSIVAALSLSLMACGNDDAASTSKSKDTKNAGDISGKVTLWTASLAGEPFDTYFKNIEKEFETQHPKVDVVIQDVPQDQMEQKVLTSLTGNDVPDVVNLNPHYMSNIAAQGGLLDLTNEVSEQTKSSFVQGPFDSGKYKGKLYALPWYLTTTISWYNGDSFDKAGVKELPTTTEGVYEAAKKVKDATGKSSYYVVVNDGNTIMEKMVSLADGKPIVKDGKSAFQDNKEILQFFELTQKCTKKVSFPKKTQKDLLRPGKSYTWQETFLCLKVV